MRRAALLALPVLAGLLALPSRAEESFVSAEVHFNLFMLGTKGFDIHMAAKRQDERLTIATAMQSAGPLNFLLRFKMQGEVAARIDGNRLQPLRYATASDGTFNQRRILMVWDEDGLPRTEVIPANEADDRDPVPLELTRATLDPTTATIARALRPGAEPPCRGSDPIFDGRRRYNLHFESVGIETLKPDSHSVYAGEAYKCTVRFERIAGYARKYEAESRKLEEQATHVWLTRARGVDVWLPVKLVSEWRLGEAVGHIASASLNGAVYLKPKVYDYTPPPEIRP